MRRTWGEHEEHLQQNITESLYSTITGPDSPVDWSEIRRIHIFSARWSRWSRCEQVIQVIQVYTLMYYVTDWMLLLGALLFIELFSSQILQQAGGHFCTHWYPVMYFWYPLLIPSNSTGWWGMNVSSSGVSDQMSASTWYPPLIPHHTHLYSQISPNTLLNPTLRCLLKSPWDAPPLPSDTPS